LVATEYHAIDAVNHGRCAQGPRALSHRCPSFRITGKEAPNMIDER
jgi:hypothetical protein